MMRSFLEHKLGSARSTHKFFYIGPMFRYERPQSGRYRQHHQFGIEAIGVAGPEQDAEVIDLLYTFYQRLGIRDLTVHLNTVGDPASRLAFRTALMDFLRPQFAELSADSQVRFEKNPLRILDSKDPKDKQLLKGAPSILDYLTPEAKEHFDQVRALLEKIGIPYVVDDRLVRGLDYYNKTVFEVVGGHLGAQNTIGGGGRFDGLISTFGGPDLPAAGWATGLERVIHVLLAQGLPWTPAITPFVYFVPLGDEAREQCFLLATACRHAKIPCDIELQAKKMQTALQNATKIGATYCVILGTEELSQQKGQLKNLQTREQKEVPFDQLVFTLKDLYV